jgi:hypothetical protein
MGKVRTVLATAINRIKGFIPRKKESTSFSLSSSLRGKINQIIQIPLFLFRHKFLFGGIAFSAALILFMGVSIYRGYFMTAGVTQKTSSAETSTSKTHASTIAKSTLVSPSPSANPSPSQSTVLGTSTDDSSSDDSENTVVSPAPVISPVPTDIPIPTLVPVSTSSDNSSSSNSNCSTGSGVPNSWYSDVYPVSPISASNGSATLTVNIRDCSINNVSSSSTLKISLSSGDTNTEVNGQTLPTTVTTHNGQASFTVSSQVAGTVGLTIQDTTDSFSITDTNNSSPSIVFGGSSAPTPTASPTTTQSISPTSGVTPTLTPTPTP